MNSAPAQQVDPQLHMPRYAQVYATLRQWITSGHYPPESRLESEARLCELFGVSRITIRKAIQMLAEQQLVTRHQGKGTFVNELTTRQPVRADMTQRIRKSRELARTSTLEQLRIDTQVAAESVCTDLQLEAGSDAIFASYVRVLRGAPVGYIESHFRTDLGITITAADFRTSTLLTLLEDKGIKLAGIDHLIGATLADARVANLLNVHIGAPIVTVKMIMLNSRHQPVEKVTGWFRADRYEHHMFLGKDTPAIQAAN